MIFPVDDYIKLSLKVEGFSSSTIQRVQDHIVAAGLPPLPNNWDWVGDVKRALSQFGWAGSFVKRVSKYYFELSKKGIRGYKDSWRGNKYEIYYPIWGSDEGDLASIRITEENFNKYYEYVNGPSSYSSDVPVRFKIPDDWFAKLGDIAHSEVQNQTYLFQFNNEFRFPWGVWGDEESCFYLSKQGAWIAFRENNCYAMLFYDPERPLKPVGRVLFRPNWPETGLITIFNGYAVDLSYQRADLTPTLRWTKVLTEYLTSELEEQFSFKKIEIKNDVGNSRLTDQVWINGVTNYNTARQKSHGYLIGRSEYIRDYSEVNIALGTEFIGECADCHEYLRTDSYGDGYRSDNNGRYPKLRCLDCYGVHVADNLIERNSISMGQLARVIEQRGWVERIQAIWNGEIPMANTNARTIPIQREFTTTINSGGAFRSYLDYARTAVEEYVPEEQDEGEENNNW